MALSPDELNREYRAALRREVQVRKRVQDLEEVLLRMKGKMLMGIQEIDLELERLAREDGRHTLAAEIRRLEAPQ